MKVVELKFQSNRHSDFKKRFGLYSLNVVSSDGGPHSIKVRSLNSDKSKEAKTSAIYVISFTMRNNVLLTFQILWFLI